MKTISTVLVWACLVVGISAQAREGDLILHCKIASEMSHLKEVSLIETDLDGQYAIYETYRDQSQNQLIYVVNDKDYQQGRIALQSTGSTKNPARHLLMGSPEKSDWLVKSNEGQNFWEVQATCKAYR